METNIEPYDDHDKNDEWKHDHEYNERHSEGIDFYSIFSKSNVVLLLWFLAIYIIVSFIIKNIYQSSYGNNELNLFTSRTFDIILLLVVIFIIIIVFRDTKNDDQQNFLEKAGQSIKNYINDSYSVFSTLLFIFFFYLIIYLFGIPMDTDNKSVFISVIETIAWILFLLCFLNIFFYSIFHLSIIDKLARIISNSWKDMPSHHEYSKWMPYTSTTTTTANADVSADELLKINSNTTTGNIKGNGNTSSTSTSSTTNDALLYTLSGKAKVSGTTTTTKSGMSRDGHGGCHGDDGSDDGDNNEKEVFNISNNLYTYKDAQAICKSYGARLATYTDIEKSYNDGAEWCNYGWSDGQMAFFPTQKDTWNELQRDPDTKNNCGRPGVNGGYMANPYLKFGVNCYGKKPAKTDADILRMQRQKDEIYAKSPKDKELDEKVNFWKQNSDSLLNINSFNNDEWSKY